MSNLGPISPKKAAAASAVAMQYTMQVFHYENDEDFRVVDRNGEPWFVLSEVCRKLGIVNSGDAASSLDEDERMTIGITDNQRGARGGARNMTIINESGLYSLVLRSRKPEAKKFKKWVTSEVLPSIRKTGGYAGKIPAFIKRYNENWDRIEPGYFSVISELAHRLWGRLEMVGHTMADKAPNGKQNRPDVSVGRRFADWIRANRPDLDGRHKFYKHKTDEWEGDAKQYPIDMLPAYIQFIDMVWIPQFSIEYFNSRDPAALPYLPRLLPKPKAA